MEKWADYLISEVSYDRNHLIKIAIRHQGTEKGITKGTPIDRLAIASDIKNGLTSLFTVPKIHGRKVTKLKRILLMVNHTCGLMETK